MVSYTRARAEGLGIECKGGLMQRPERVVLIGLSALACGIISKFIGGDYKFFIPGISFHVFETMSIFTLPITVLAILTNITAVKRLLDSKKALQLKDKQKNLPVAAIVLLSLLIPAASHSKSIDPQDTFSHTGKKLPIIYFYLQRTPNTNTIICDINLKNNRINEDEPVHVYWLRYAEKGQKQELNFIQRTFAYGMKTTALGNDKYELHFVSYKKYHMYLMKSPLDHAYHVYGNILNKQAIVTRIFLLVNGGSFWSPHIEYVEVKRH